MSSNRKALCAAAGDNHRLWDVIREYDHLKRASKRAEGAFNALRAALKNEQRTRLFEVALRRLLYERAVEVCRRHGIPEEDMGYFHPGQVNVALSRPRGTPRKRAGVENGP